MKRYKILKEWKTEAGLTAYTVVSMLGYINGYVAVDSSHKAYGHDYYVYSVDFNDLSLWESKEQRRVQREINEIDVHGGLTNSDKITWSLIEEDDVWLFGFTCAHTGDGHNFQFAFKHLSEQGDTFEELTERFNCSKPYKDNTWKDEKFVETECESLAKQLQNIY